MTITELIEFLQQFPQDLEVWKVEEGNALTPVEEEDLAELDLTEDEEGLEHFRKVLIINFESTS